MEFLTENVEARVQWQAARSEHDRWSLHIGDFAAGVRIHVERIRGCLL